MTFDICTHRLWSPLRYSFTGKTLLNIDTKFSIKMPFIFYFNFNTFYKNPHIFVFDNSSSITQTRQRSLVRSQKLSPLHWFVEKLQFDTHEQVAAVVDVQVLADLGGNHKNTLFLLNWSYLRNVLILYFSGLTQDNMRCQDHHPVWHQHPRSSQRQRNQYHESIENDHCEHRPWKLQQRLSLFCVTNWRSGVFCPLIMFFTFLQSK